MSCHYNVVSSALRKIELWTLVDACFAIQKSVVIYKMDPTPEICISREYNGLYFCDRYIAKELVSFILTRVDYKSIANCRLVCKQWRTMIGDPLFWKHKTELEKRNWPNVPRDPNIPWRFFASVYFYGFVGKNLLKNHNGKGRIENNVFIIQLLIIFQSCNQFTVLLT